MRTNLALLIATFGFLALTSAHTTVTTSCGSSSGVRPACTTYGAEHHDTQGVVLSHHLNDAPKSHLLETADEHLGCGLDCDLKCKYFNSLSTSMCVGDAD